MKFKKLIALGLAAVMAVGLIGCGGGGADKTEAPAGEVEADGEVDKSQKLVIYSNSFSNDQDAWLLDAATKAGFNIECVAYC